MSDELARAVAARGAITVSIAGKQCTVRPLSIRELCEAERDCVQRYKRAYLETYARNLDLLPEAERSKLLERKLEEAARWDVNDLPAKHAHDPEKIRPTPELRAWVEQQFGESADDGRLKRLAAAALDQEMLEASRYRELTGCDPPRVKVPYVHWWITGSFEGMITFVWLCFRSDGVAREQVEAELGKNPALLVELSREISRLSTPDVGNG